MIEPMEKIYLYSLKSQSEEILETLLRMRILEPVQTKDVSIAADKAAENGTIGLVEEKQLLDRLQAALHFLKPMEQKKELFAKRATVSYAQLTDQKMLEEACRYCRQVEQNQKKMETLQKRRAQVQFQKAALEPWRRIPLTAAEQETETCRVWYCTWQAPQTVEDLRRMAAEEQLPLYMELIQEEKGRQYAVVILYQGAEDALEARMRTLGLERQRLDIGAGTVEEMRKNCIAEIAHLEEEMQNLAQKREQLAQHRGQLELAADAVRVKIQRLEERQALQSTETVELMTGWVPRGQKASLERCLQKYDCLIDYRVPEPEESFPVLLKNSKLVEPFGTITELYSLPDARSIDTNWAIGWFFFLFFGMMLSDAGYGLVLFAAGFVGARILNVGESAKRMLRMLGICGVSTIFWGALYGSWFGDAIPTICETFFDVSITIPTLIDPLKEPMVVLLLACFLGVVHLFTGMGIKAYLLIRQGDPWGALFDVGFWYVFLIGLPLLLAPGSWNTAGQVLSAAGALGLILTQGRRKQTILGKLVSGVMSLYNVTGYFSDVLSYSRVLALGLATGVVASVVNIMGTLAGGSILGAILFLAVFLAGHLLNLGINALGAYVHAARLQYVEFFGKYYEGGGKKFEPLSMKTKYVTVMEEK